MATSCIDQVFDKLRIDETFLNLFKTEVRKINGFEEKQEEMIENDWQKAYFEYMDICDDILSDVSPLSSPQSPYEQIADSEEPTYQDWTDTNNEIEYLGTFNPNEPLDLTLNKNYDPFNGMISTIEEEVTSDLNAFSFTDILPLKDKFHSAMAQFTLFAGNQLVCYLCFNSLMVKSGETLSCTSCDYGIISRDTIEGIIQKVKSAVSEHSAQCPEIFMHFGVCDDALRVSCDGQICTFNKFIDV